MKQIMATNLSAALFLSIGACGKSDSKKEVSKPPVAVEVRAASSNSLSDGIEVTGSLERKFSVDVKTQIPGLIRQVMVSEWVHVRKGQPLVRIDVAEPEAQVKRSDRFLLYNLLALDGYYRRDAADVGYVHSDGRSGELAEAEMERA